MKKAFLSVFVLTFLLISTAASFASSDSLKDLTGSERGVYDYDTGIYYVNDNPQLTRTTSYVGGGTWKYDCGINKTYSHYFHKSKTHSASVRNTNTTKRVKKDGGIWAKAWLYTTPSGNKVYWNTY